MPQATTTQAPATGAATAPAPARRRQGRRAVVVRGAVVVALLALTGWNWTRSQGLEEARAAYARSDWKTAVRRALDHLDRRPWSREAAKLAALGLSQLDFADLAEPYYRRAGPLGLEDLHARALGIFHANRREQAIRAYREILDHWPDEPRALRMLVVILMTQSRYPEAMAPAERLARLPGSAVLGYTMVGSIAHDMRDYDRAVVAMARVLELDPELRHQSLPPRQFWVQYGQDLLETSHFGPARDALQRALALDEGAPLAWELLGRVEWQLSRFDEAERCWRRAIALAPDFVAPWLGLGRLALNRRRPEEAIAHFDRARALAPDLLEPVFGLSQAHAQLGHAAEAARFRALAEKMRAQSPGPERGMGARPGASP
jgi:tetratricopeptide (TPR) repeat protein